MTTFIVTMRTASGRQRINVIAACSIDALMIMAEKFHGQTASFTVRPGAAK